MIIAVLGCHILISATFLLHLVTGFVASPTITTNSRAGLFYGGGISSTATTRTALSVATPAKPSLSSQNVQEEDGRGNGVSSAERTSNTTASSSSSSSSSRSLKKQSFSKLVPKISNGGSQSRLKRLKDYIWMREALEDLTAAEFACSVESHLDDDESTSSSSSSITIASKLDSSAPERAGGRRRRRAVDYEKLLQQLNKRIRDMGCYFNPRDAQLKCILQSGVGSGSFVYSDQQRQSTLDRLIRTRQMLMEVIRGVQVEKEARDTAAAEAAKNETGLPFAIVLPELPELPELRVELPKEPDVNPDSVGPKLYVRDDGTVDWDGALQDKAALRKFGTAVWARINGREPELSITDSITSELGESTSNKDGKSMKQSPSSSSSQHATTPKAVTARIVETEEIIEARAKLLELKEELAQKESQHTAMLNSVMRAGQAVANVNLAMLNPEQRRMITESAESLEFVKEKVSFSNMIYELERVYTYLAGEFGNPAMKGYISLQDRLNVAEFGLIESQVDSFSSLLDAGENIDADVLAVVAEQLNDFKRRLGIDYSVTGVTFDRDAILRWIAVLYDQTKTGLAFYVKGCSLFWNDIVFCLSLINRAAQGYTLKPREVRTIRYVSFVFYAPTVQS
jgi:hypothetical protein